MRRLAFAALMVIGAACGGADGSRDTAVEAAPTTGAAVVGATTTTIDAPATTAPASSPGVAAISTGRGDDGSLEVGVWFAADPFELGAQVRVGTDADDSYPGVGDPVPHIDAWADVDGSDAVLVDAGETVARGDELNQWMSWTGAGRTVRFFFFETVPVRAGTLWVVVSGVDGVGLAAGVDVGEGCSHHGTGVDLGAVPSDVPQQSMPCRYP